MSIKELPRDLIEKIAAGEVVERPVSVVKELVENAIDAGASHIDVILEKAGTAKIEVRDDGVGMDASDLVLSVKAHATSKITSADDLFAIHTLGFRGEALASISAVSVCTVRTKQANEIAGRELVVRGGVSEQIKPCAANTGTTVIVEDLFYNVPARQKFLKTHSTELQLILSLMTQFVLSHPSVGFTVSHNGATLIQSSSSNDLVQKIKDIYGKTIATQTLAVSYVQEGISIKGLVVKPSQVRSDKKGMSFFINGRYVRNSEFARSVIEGYDTLLMIGKYPLCVLHVEIDPSIIDVNVHPRKDIIKIEDELSFLKILKEAVAQTFQTQSLIREVASETVRISKQDTFLSTKYDTDADVHLTLSSSLTGEFDTGKEQNADEPSKEFNALAKPKVFTNDSITDSVSHSIETITPSKQNYVTQKQQHVLRETPNIREDMQKQLSVRYIGLLHKTYAICEDAQGLVMVDFHAAHERWNYERFMDQYYNKTVQTQSLLQPLILEVTPTHRLLIEKHGDLLKNWGFDIDEFGESEFVLRTIPIILGRSIDPSYFFDLLGDIEVEISKNSLEVMQQKIITSMSCKASDKAGDDLSDERVKELIQFALDSKMKYACPHGRPTFVRMTKSELEKMFKRRV